MLITLSIYSYLLLYSLIFLFLVFLPRNLRNGRAQPAVSEQSLGPLLVTYCISSSNTLLQLHSQPSVQVPKFASEENAAPNLTNPAPSKGFE